MAKIANTPEVKDLEDLGYQQAGNFDASQKLAEFALANIAGFPDEVPTEAKDKLYAGYRKRFSQNNPAKVYAVIGGHYVPVSYTHLTLPTTSRV